MSKRFHQTEVGAVVSMCTHDIVNAASLSGGMVRRLLREIEENDGEIPIVDLVEKLKIIQERQDKINDSVDYLYEKVKKLQGY